MAKPKGLAAKKKAADAALQAQAAAPADDSTMQVQVQLPEGAAECDELAELKACFDAAIEKMEQGDAEEGAALLRGVVHECDLMVRLRFQPDANNDHTSSEKQQPESLAPLTSEFHFLYGSSLYRLGLIVLDDEMDAKNDSTNLVRSSKSPEESCIEYLDAALERLEIGLDMDSTDATKDEFAWRLRDASARILIQKANITLRRDEQEGILTPENMYKETDSLISKAVEQINHAIKSLTSTVQSSSARDEEVASMVSAISRHAELRMDLDGHVKWNKTAKDWFKDLLKSSPTCIPALQGLGATYLASANFYLDQADQGESEVDTVVVGDLLNDALKYLNEAESEYKKQSMASTGKSDAEIDVNVSLLCLLGEVLVNKANILDEEDDQEEANRFYKLAVDAFKKVEASDPDALPEQFGSFLRDWEADMEVDA